MKGKRLKALMVVAVLLVAPSVGTASEIEYYLSVQKDTPKDKQKVLKTAEDDTMTVVAEPVAQVPGSEVTEAVIVREDVEVLDEDDPVSEIYRVRLVMSDTQNAKLAKVMDELCKSKPGVHIAVDAVIVDYRPFAICGKFTAEVSFTSKQEAEAFANKISPKAVRFAEPPKG